MTPATLAVLAPLAVGFHPSGCKDGNCPPVPPPAAAVYGPFPTPPMLTPNCPPVGPPAPVLAVTIVAPAGTRVTAQPGTPEAKMFPAPAALGLRPGYRYRLELTGIPNRPDVVLYPQIEVRGSLAPRAAMNVMNHPVPVAFTDADLARAANGALVTKVFYLEDPAVAAPVRTAPDRPLELISDTLDDALLAAQQNGRLVAVVRLGDRKPTPEEMACETVPGTVLMPGDTTLSPAAAPPAFGWCGIPLYDPISGPKVPSEECIPDGGDTGPRLGIGPGGRLGGLNPTDVAAEFTQRGVRKVTTSNSVCVCVPRFVARRVDVVPGGLSLALRAEAGIQAARAGAVQDRLGVEAMLARTRAAETDIGVRAAAQIGRDVPIIAIAEVGPPRAVAVARGVRVIATAVEPEETTNAEGFVVTKSVDPKAGVKIGDEVTFTLRYRNKTADVLTEVVLSDSLSPRLEYVPGSAKTDRPANVSAEANEAGSQIVRFDIPGGLQPGEGGVVTFRARVR